LVLFLTCTGRLARAPTASSRLVGLRKEVIRPFFMLGEKGIEWKRGGGTRKFERGTRGRSSPGEARETTKFEHARRTLRLLRVVSKCVCIYCH
jgi:hypothetical protein